MTSNIAKAVIRLAQSGVPNKLQLPIKAARSFFDISSFEEYLNDIPDTKNLVFSKSEGLIHGADPSSNDTKLQAYLRFINGYSVVINSLHHRVSNLKQLNDKCQITLGRECGINAYLTPPHSQGFPLHHDPHDVVVIQIHGTKHWDYYYENNKTSITLEVGDLLFLPAGISHVARSKNSSSLHLSIGIQNVRQSAATEMLYSNQHRLFQSFVELEDMTLSSAVERTEMFKYKKCSDRINIGCEPFFCTVPNEMVKALEFIAGNLNFRVNDLPNIFSEKSKLKLISLLVMYGQIKITSSS